ncbi:MAG TPA: RNA polymerase subunit sigma-70 [Solirubrobacteraceae bacterium]|nr:RNA polymerase subunit sigma-70 [Solirubrobacteraceae bacterium]
MLAAAPTVDELEAHRPALTAYCYRMLGSPFSAEDAVQETLLRAWRGAARFEGRAAVKSWLYRIATNVCLREIERARRRARPMDLGPARAPEVEHLGGRDADSWIEPLPMAMIAGEDPADAVVSRESVRLAFVAALQRLPARQRAALVLCEVLHWTAAEAAELLEASEASVNSALQRARGALRDLDRDGMASEDGADRAVLDRWVAAFEAYDLDALATLMREDVVQSMPPYELWLDNRADLLAWMAGPGAGCAGSRILPAGTANGLPAFAQYRPDPAGGHAPWGLHVLDVADGGIAEVTVFLDVERLFGLFGLPAHL